MALDHSRLGVAGSWKTNQIEYGCVQTNLLYFLYITSEMKEYYEALFLSYRPQTIGSQFHNFSRQIAFILT